MERSQCLQPQHPDAHSTGRGISWCSSSKNEQTNKIGCTITPEVLYLDKHKTTRLRNGHHCPWTPPGLTPRPELSLADRASWFGLQDQNGSELCAKKSSGRGIRVWDSGCSGFSIWTVSSRGDRLLGRGTNTMVARFFKSQARYPEYVKNSYNLTMKGQITQFLKRTKNLSRHFSKGDIRVANKHIKNTHYH